MSTIEERLSRDIEAVTGGIVVTDSDLRDARVAVEDRIESRQQRDRRRGVVLAAAAAAVVVGVATWQGLQGDDVAPSPAPPGPTEAPAPLSTADRAFLKGDAVTAETLAGVWRLDNPTTSHMLFSFTADGGVGYDDTGQLSEDPLVSGTYDIAGDQINVVVGGGLAQCEGQTLVLRALVNQTGGLNVVPAEPFSCGLPDRHQLVLERVLPTSVLAGLSPDDVPNWDPPAGHEAVRGTWFAEGGGYVVELRADGNYSVLAGYGEVIDRGTWADDDSSTRLTLTSSADSPTCEEGDRFVLGDLRARNQGALVLKGTLERDDCAGGFAKEAWFKLAP